MRIGAAFACLMLFPGAGLALPVERCINLSNYLEVPKNEGWAYAFKPAHIDAIAAAGFDTLRVPINAGDHWNGTTLDPDFADHVQSVVTRARHAGLFVIVDLHHFDAFVEDPVGQAPAFLGIWSALSEMFEGQEGLAFELLNEPTGDSDIAEFLPLFDEAREIIRKRHPEAWVIYGGAHWNNLKNMLALPKSADPKVAHTFHYYVPFKFTHQQLPWSDNPMPPRTWGTQAERDKVSDSMARASEHHTPVFLGEFGAIDTIPSEDRLTWLSHVRAEAESAGLPWCHWGFGARFGVFDPKTDTWKSDVLDALID